jgi:hypothetical protein
VISKRVTKKQGARRAELLETIALPPLLLALLAHRERKSEGIFLSLISIYIDPLPTLSQSRWARRARGQGYITSYSALLARREPDMKAQHPPNLFERGLLVKAPSGWPSRCTPTLTQEICLALQHAGSLHAAAQQCGVYPGVLATFLQKGEAAAAREEMNCYTTFFRAFMLALASSPNASRYMAQVKWQRRYWLALGHRWLADLYMQKGLP